MSATERGLRRAERRLAQARRRVASDATILDAKAEVEHFANRLFEVGGQQMKACSICSRAVPVEGEDAWRSHAKNCPLHRPPRPEKPVRAPRVARARGTSTRPRCEGTGALIGRLEVTKPGENPRVRCPVCSGSVGTSGGKVGFHYRRGSR